MTKHIRHLVTSLACVALVALTSCTGPGINAGEKGGVAWIAMAGMIIVTGIVLYLFLDRDE